MSLVLQLLVISGQRECQAAGKKQRSQCRPSLVVVVCLFQETEARAMHGQTRTCTEQKLPMTSAAGRATAEGGTNTREETRKPITVLCGENARSRSLESSYRKTKASTISINIELIVQHETPMTTVPLAAVGVVESTLMDADVRAYCSTQPSLKQKRTQQQQHDKHTNQTDSGRLLPHRWTCALCCDNNRPATPNLQTKS